jgi:transposase
MLPPFTNGGSPLVRLGELVMILDLHWQGVSISAIARRAGLDRKTVRRYIARGLEPPAYGPRKPRRTQLRQFENYLRERLAAFPQLTARRLFRELREHGYAGGYTILTDFLRDLRPPLAPQFERRFETPPGQQAQVDFAQFQTEFTDEPGVIRKIWLFSMVLGHSRMMWGRFVAQQNLPTVLRCHIEAFEAFGGAPAQILYDRMKTAILGEDDQGGIAYNRLLLECARHYSFIPKPCAPYRAKTKGKVERPFRYVREDFFLGRSFRNLEDLNAQFQQWRDEVANARVHATTRRVVAEHFAEERPSLKPLPEGRFCAVLRLDRRITNDGLISLAGNQYSVPDGVQKRVVEVHTLADELRIFDAGKLIAAHPRLEGRGQRLIAAGHRRRRQPLISADNPEAAAIVARPGEIVACRSLAFYEAVGKRLAAEGRP